jgi:DNA-binding response OmpR family regulator
MTRAIYLINEPPLDSAILNGLHAAKCEVLQVQSIAEALQQIRVAEADKAPVILICELDAGAIPLLALLRDNLNMVSLPPARDAQNGNHTYDIARALPPTMIYDRGGHDITSVIQAFHYGARDYVLASAPEPERELAARLLAERCQAFDSAWNLYGAPRSSVAATVELPQPSREPQPPTPIASVPAQTAFGPAGVEQHVFEWDANKNVIHCQDESIYVSPTEGRIFDLLARYRGCIVSTEDLIQHALQDPGSDADASVERIRTHVMKLRRKLDSHPATANRVVNVRGTGYMLV